MNNLDVLRAVAVLSVFFHHVNHVYGFNIPFFGPYGGIFGIQLFFLLSGFLIIKSAVKHSLKAYFLHRVFRIYPAYILVFIVIGIFTGVLTWEKVFNNPWGLISNILSLQHLFPKNLIVYDSLHVSWTLTVELIWYVLAPLSIGLLSKRLHLTLASTILISVAWVYFSANGVFDFLYADQFKEIDLSLTHSRTLFLINAFPAQLCYFVFGACIYYKQEQLMKLNPYFLSAVFIIFVLFFPYGKSPEFNPSFITGIGLAALFLLALVLPTLNFKPLKIMADISYSFYLIHLTVISIAHDYFGLNSNWYIILVFVIAVFGSVMLYWFIEKPMMRMARKVSR